MDIISWADRSLSHIRHVDPFNRFAALALESNRHTRTHTNTHTHTETHTDSPRYVKASDGIARSIYDMHAMRPKNDLVVSNELLVCYNETERRRRSGIESVEGAGGGHLHRIA